MAPGQVDDDDDGDGMAMLFCLWWWDGTATVDGRDGGWMVEWQGGRNSGWRPGWARQKEQGRPGDIYVTAFSQEVYGWG